MITAKEANKKTLEAIRNDTKLQEKLKEKYYLETLNRIEKHINKQIKDGYSFVDLKTNWMRPNVERLIRELQSNGYKVTLFPSDIIQEHLMIEW